MGHGVGGSLFGVSCNLMLSHNRFHEPFRLRSARPRWDKPGESRKVMIVRGSNRSWVGSTAQPDTVKTLPLVN